MIKLNKFLEEDFELGHMQAGRIYAIPFSTVYSNVIDQIITNYPFGNLKVGIYSDSVGSPASSYPDALILDLGTPTFAGNDAIFSINTAFDRDNYWLVCFSDREIPILSRRRSTTILAAPSAIYNTTTKIGGQGYVKEYGSGTLPGTYPSNADLIPNGDFAPFFFIGVTDYVAAGGGGGGGASGYSGFSGRSGYSGFSGTNGATGTSGFSGYSGVSGYSGTNGTNGSTGTSGFSGANGSTGTSGFSGVSGFSGYSGVSGFSGKSGFSGTNGATGTSGFSGMFGGDSQPYGFDVVTADADPGVGYLRLNNVSISSVSRIYISEFNSDSVDVSAWISALDDVSGSTRGRLRIVNMADSSRFADYTINAANTSGTGYQKINVTYVTGNGSFSPIDKLIVTFVFSGESGYSGSAGSAGTSGFSGAVGTSGVSGFSGAGVSGFSGFSGMFGGDSQPYLFDASIVDADPGNGNFRFNDPNPATASRIFINDTNSDAVNVLAWIDALDDITSTVRGRIRCVKRDDSSIFVDFDIISANISATGYTKVLVSYVTGSGVFNPGDSVIITFAFAGASGFSGTNGSTGTSGFSGYSGYSGKSGFSGFSGSSAVASLPADEVAYGTGGSITSTTDFKWESADQRIYANGGLRLKINSTTTPYNVQNNDYTVNITNAGVGGGVVNLPLANVANAGQIFNVKNSDLANTVALTPSGGDTIDGTVGALTVGILNNVTVQSDGANNWIIL